MNPCETFGTKFSIIKMMIVTKIWQIYIFCEGDHKNNNGLTIDGIGRRNYCMHIALKSLSKYIFILHSGLLKSHGCIE